MTTDQWFVLLDELVERTGLSRPQIEQRSGVPAKTLTSWLRGDVLHPRQWQPLARVLRALRASAAEAEAVLRAAGDWKVAELARKADDADNALLSHWLKPDVTYQAPDSLAPSVIGRDDAIEAAINMLRLHRRCALVGMGGVGKTTLAVEIAHRLRDDYRDGVFWGDLALSSLEAILESWGQAFGVDMSRIGDIHSRATRVRGIFSQKRALIILDDVVDAEPAGLLLPARHSDSAVLSTTRSHDVARALTGFQQGLVVPLEPLTREHSLRVMADVIGPAGVAEQEEHARRVADLLGDLPLALRIAASLCRPADPAAFLPAGLTLAQLATLLQQLQSRLETLQVDRKAAVRLAFEHSWQYLDQTLRAAFAAMAVFEGRPFTREAIAAIAGLEPERAVWALSQLSRLSLLQLRSAGRRRYQQHPLLAAFASEKLGDDARRGELAASQVWKSYAGYHHRLAADHRSRGVPLEGEWENVMAGMRVAGRLRDWRLALNYREALEGEWERNGLYSMARDGYALALEAAEALAQPEAMAGIELRWGQACLDQAEYGPARQHLTAALARLETLDDRQRIGDALLALARVDFEENAFERAEQGLRAAWLSYQQTEDLRGMGMALYRMGRIHYMTSDFDGTLQLAGDAIATLTSADDPPALLHAHMLAAQAYIYQDVYDAAQRHIEEGGRQLQRVDDASAATDFVYTSAELYRWQQRYPESRQSALQALDYYSRVYDTKSQIHTLMLLANMEMEWNEAEPERREYDASLGHIEQGIRLCGLIGYDFAVAHFLLTRGRLHAQQGRTEEAVAAWQEALAISRSIENGWLVNRLSGLLADAG